MPFDATHTASTEIDSSRGLLMFNRRQFFGVAVSGLGALSVGRISRSASSRVDRGFEYGAPLLELEYAQVSLHAGQQQAQLEETHRVLMELSEDSLLRPFRLRAGLAAPGCNLGGWYSADEFAGETFGQWVSALSRHYAISHDDETRTKVDRLVSAFAETIEPSGKLYGDTKVTTGPSYLYDKLICGFMDAHQFARQGAALAIASRATEAVRTLLPGKAVNYRPEDSGAHESYTIPENQFITWQRGGTQAHFDLAIQYLYHDFFDPLSAGVNVLAGRHAYSHVNALCSAAKAYLVLGDEKYLRAAVNGFRFVEAQSFATGGWGPNETFLPSPAAAWSGMPPIASLGESLTLGHRHFETPCGAYAHFKLTRYLLRATKDPSYGDSMEKVMYNTVLGARPLLKDGRAFYQSDYNPDGHKFYFDGYGGEVLAEWPCCSGTLTQIAADYRLGAYFTDARGIYVNLFVPSTVTWKCAGSSVALTQSGNYPLGDVVSFSMTLSRQAEFELRVRIPSWCDKATLRVNGKGANVPVVAGNFCSVRRLWHTGDRVELELPKELRLQAVDAEHPSVVAVCYGPLVLFAVGADAMPVSRRSLLMARRSGPESGEWSVDLAGGRRLRLIPFWDIRRSDGYTTYLSVV